MFTKNELAFAQEGGRKTRSRSKSPSRKSSSHKGGRAKSPSRSKSPSKKSTSHKGGDVISTLGSMVFPYGVTQTLATAGLTGLALTKGKKSHKGGRSKSPSRSKTPTKQSGGKTRSRSKSPSKKASKGRK